MINNFSKWDGVSHPNLDNAVMYTRPNAVSWRITQQNGCMVISNWVDSDKTEIPSSQEVLDNYKKLIDIWKKDEYKRQRIELYGSIGDQLDILYNDIKSGNINGEWIKHIDKVKNTIPKPY